MSTEVTAESLRAHAAFLRSRGMVEFEVAIWDRWADRLEREQRPLPTVPGWYPTVVVERGGESCTGAMLTDGEYWQTARSVGGRHVHTDDEHDVTIRWAEQDGTTPGQTLWELWYGTVVAPDAVWSEVLPASKKRYEWLAVAVLAAHGTPTLTPVGEHPKPGTRGLLPVVVNASDEWVSKLKPFHCVLEAESEIVGVILADPRPDGAHA